MFANVVATEKHRQKYIETPLLSETIQRDFTPYTNIDILMYDQNSQHFCSRILQMNCVLNENYYIKL